MGEIDTELRLTENISILAGCLVHAVKGLEVVLQCMRIEQEKNRKCEIKLA